MAASDKNVFKLLSNYDKLASLRFLLGKFTDEQEKEAKRKGSLTF